MAATINNNPLVSIVIPCYRQAEFLPETLESVLAQKYQNWECLIISDESPDHTDEIAREWIEKDARFNYFEKKNGGVSDARNFGIDIATGEFILPLDADDKISADYIKEAIGVFISDTSTKLVYSNLIYFGKINKQEISEPYVYENMLAKNLIFCSAIFRKEDFQKTSGYNINMKKGLEDWDFWLTFLHKDDKVVKLDSFHFLYRIKDISRSASIDINSNEQLLLQIFKNHIPLYLQYYNPIRDHIEASYYKWESELYKNSIDFKIGYYLCLPFKLARNGIKRLLRIESDEK